MQGFEEEQLAQAAWRWECAWTVRKIGKASIVWSNVVSVRVIGTELIEELGTTL